MTTLLFSRPFLYSSLPIGLGIGLSFFHPSSPFQLQLPFSSNSSKTAIPLAIQCQYTAPYYSPNAPPESGWSLRTPDSPLHKQGQTGPGGKSTNDSRILTASVMRQISLGSVLGLVAGLGLRVFSKAFAFVIGVGVVLVEWAAARGYNIIPVNRLQKYVKSVDLHRFLAENMAFKTSFGTAMAMAAFAQF